MYKREITEFKDREGTDKWLKEHRREYDKLIYHFSEDDNNDKASKFETAKLRLLFVMLSDGPTRSVSNTLNAVFALCRQKVDREDLFLDFCFFPHAQYRDAMIEDKVPLMHGSIAHAPWHEYDAVLVSHSIQPECFNIPHMFYNSGVSLGHKSRLNEEGTPLIVYGGAASIESILITGAVGEDETDRSLVDIGLMGYGDHWLPQEIIDLMKMKTELGDIKSSENKKKLMEYLIAESPQKGNYYFPWAYKFNWINNLETGEFKFTGYEKLDERVPDRVKVNDVKDGLFLGWTQKHFLLSGENANSSEIMISKGCSSGSCSFKVVGDTWVYTEEGPKRIEELVGKKTDKILSTEMMSYRRVEKQEDAKVVNVWTEDGTRLKVDKEHKFMVYEKGELLEKTTEELEIGDKILKKQGIENFGGYKRVSNIRINERFADLLGFMMADGHIPSRNTEIQVFMKGKEVDHYYPILEEYFGDRKKRVQHVCKDGTDLIVYCKNIYDKVAVFEELGLRSNCDKMRVPEIIFKSPKSVIESFLKGVFQGDGWSNKDIGLTSINYEFLEDINKLLLMVGVRNKIRTRKAPMPKKCKENGSKESFMIKVIDSDSILRFRKNIGFIDKKLDVVTRKITPIFPVNSNIMKELDRKIKDKGMSYQKIKIDRTNIIRSGLSRHYLSKLEDYGIDLSIANLIKEFFITEVSRVEYTEEVSEMYDVVETDNNLCVYDMTLTHQCHEGVISGAWQEKDLATIKEELKEVKRQSAPNNVSSYSYNLNYYAHFLDLLGLYSQEFSTMSLINNRTDIMAAEPDYIRLSKALGLRRFSGAVEGFGDRIRNKILNKNLPREVWMQAVRNILAEKVTEYKWG